MKKLLYMLGFAVITCLLGFVVLGLYDSNELSTLISQHAKDLSNGREMKMILVVLIVGPFAIWWAIKSLIKKNK